MKLEKKSNDELVRKIVSTVKAIGKKCYKRRKVKFFVPNMIGEPVVNEEQDEVSEESHSSSISSSSSTSWCVKSRDDIDLSQKSSSRDLVTLMSACCIKYI